MKNRRGRPRKDRKIAPAYLEGGALAVASVCGVPLSVMQQAILRACEGLPLTEAEVALFAAHAGREYTGPVAYKEAWLALGRQAGKTDMASLVVLGEVLKPRVIPKGQRFAAILIAPSESQAGIAFKRILARLEAHWPQTIIGLNVQQGIIETANGIDLLVLAGNVRTARGYSAVIVFIDEAAHFHEAGSHPIEEIITALRPALAITDGRLIGCSTPRGKRGPLWEAFSGRAEQPDLLCVQATTKECNPEFKDSTLAYHRRKMTPETFAQEYEARFLDGNFQYLHTEKIDAAIVRGMPCFPPEAGFSYVAALDPSSTGDEFAFCVAGRSPASPERVVCAVVESIRRQVGQVSIDPIAALDRWIPTLKHYGIRKVACDKELRSFVTAHLKAAGIAVVNESAYGRKGAAKFEVFRDKLHSGHLRLPDNKQLRGQLASLDEIFAPGGAYVAGRGAHDDIAVVAALAVWLSTENAVYRAPDIEFVPNPHWRPSPISPQGNVRWEVETNARGQTRRIPWTVFSS